MTSQDLTTWYRSAGIEPIEERLSNLCAGIKEYIPSRSEIVALTRLFCELGKPDENSLGTFTASLQKGEPSFRVNGAERELSLLAGVALAELIGKEPTRLADLGALLLVCAAVQNLRPAPAVAEIPEIAVRYLSKRAVHRMAQENTESDDALLVALTAPGSDRLAKEYLRQKTEIAVLAEETNILWWLFSEYSRDLKKPWNKASVPEVVLVAGKELADLTRVIPGPVAAPAILRKVIRYARPELANPLTIKDAINNLTLPLRQKYVAEIFRSELQQVLPIAYGIKISTSTENGDALEAFSQQTGISPNQEIDPAALGYQIFLEVLLCRVWSNLEEKQ